MFFREMELSKVASESMLLSLETEGSPLGPKIGRALRPALCPFDQVRIVPIDNIGFMKDANLPAIVPLRQN